MTWRGSVLTGVEGSNLLSTLIDRANEQCVSLSGENTSSRYQPWMSNAIHRLEWSSLNTDTPEVVPRPSQLCKLRSAFSGHGPLAKLNPENTSQEIDTREETWFEFSTEITTILEIIKAVSKDYSARVEKLVLEVIPLTNAWPRPFRFDGEGLSSQGYRGAIFLKLAGASSHSRCENLLNLVHEMGHGAFNVIVNADPIIEGDITRPIFSVIRKTMRPGIMSFHALIATAYMVEIMARAPRVFLETAPADWLQTRFDQLVQDLSLALATIRSLRLTPWGLKVISECNHLLRFAQTVGAPRG